MTPQPRLLRFAVAIACLTLVACSTASRELTDGAYTMTSLRGQPLPEQPTIRLTLGNGRIAGHGPINRWTGTLDEDHRVGPLASTRMAGPPEWMDLEHQLLQALDGATLRPASRGRIHIIRNDKVVGQLDPAPE